LCNEELYNLYSSPNIIRVVKSRKMRWTGHVTCLEEIRNAYKLLVGKHEGNIDYLGSIGIDGRKIVKQI
jgi:hypothetical protein